MAAQHQGWQERSSRPSPGPAVAKPETPKPALEVQAEFVRWESRTPTTMKAGSWWLLPPEAWLLLPCRYATRGEMQGLEVPSSTGQYLGW